MTISNKKIIEVIHVKFMQLDLLDQSEWTYDRLYDSPIFRYVANCQQISLMLNKVYIAPITKFMKYINYGHYINLGSFNISEYWIFSLIWERAVQIGACGHVINKMIQCVGNNHAADIRCRLLYMLTALVNDPDPIIARPLNELLV